MSPFGNLTIQCMAILNGIMGPGLAGVLTEMNSVVEFVSRQLSLPPPVMKIVSSDNLKDDSLNFGLNTVSFRCQNFF